MIAIYELYTSLAGMGYVGVFILSALGTSSIFFNAAYYSIVYGMGATPIFNPNILIISSSIGAALGDFVSYGIGYSARKFLVNSRYYKFFQFAEKWFKKSGFLTIIFFVLSPLPDDIVGIIAGSGHYQKKRFYLACLIGKIIQTTFLVYAGKVSYDYFFNKFLK